MHIGIYARNGLKELLFINIGSIHVFHALTLAGGGGGVGLRKLFEHEVARPSVKMLSYGPSKC